MTSEYESKGKEQTIEIVETGINPKIQTEKCKICGKKNTLHLIAPFIAIWRATCLQCGNTIIFGDEALIQLLEKELR